MARSDPPPENPYASPQAVDGLISHPVRGIDVRQLQTEVRGTRFICWTCGVLMVLMIALVGLSAVLDELGMRRLPGPIFAGALAVAMIWILANLVAFGCVISTARRTSGLWTGLIYILLMIVLNAVGNLLVPVLIQSDFNRRYGHLLNARDD